LSKKNGPQLPPVPGPQRADRPTRSAAKSERRAEAARIAQEQRRKARRRTVLIQGGVAVGVVLVVIVATVAVLASRDSGGPVATPSGITDKGGVLVGNADAPVVVQAVEDFQCPHCAAFEQESGPLLASYEAGQDVAVEYRGIAFLDSMSSTDYSTRSLNASACVVSNAGTDVWKKFHDALFAHQPEEGGDGLPDSQLVQLASDAGAGGDDVASCIEDGTYEKWAKRTTDAAFDDGVSSTPTVFVNGQKITAVDQAGIKAAVEAAS
jgi:protein-disulfide isomerase